MLGKSVGLMNEFEFCTVACHVWGAGVIFMQQYPIARWRQRSRDHSRLRASQSLVLQAKTVRSKGRRKFKEDTFHQTVRNKSRRPSAQQRDQNMSRLGECVGWLLKGDDTWLGTRGGIYSENYVKRRVDPPELSLYTSLTTRTFPHWSVDLSRYVLNRLRW